MSERARRSEGPEDTRVSGAKPKPEGRIRERGWRPTRCRNEVGGRSMEAARRRANEAADGAELSCV